MTLAMADYRKPPPPPDTERPHRSAELPAVRDPRRQTGRRVETPGPRRYPSRPGLELPVPIEPRDDDDAFRRRLLSEVDVRLRGMAEGLSRTLDDRLAPLDRIVAMLEEDREERAQYRADREAREKVEREQREQDMHRLALQRGSVEIAKMNVEVQQVPVEATRKYKLALYGVIASVLIALAGLIGAAIGSWRKS